MGKRVRKVKSDPLYDRALGMHIKKLREELNWSQGDLASHSSVSSTQISVIENGRESAQMYTIVAIANAFGLTPSEFLDFPFEFKLNKDFSSSRKNRKSGVTDTIRKLYEHNYFKTPKSVQDVIQGAKRKHNITMMSAEASGALLYLVNNGKLKKIREKNNRNLYQNK